MTELIFLTKTGCHLCDEARDVVERVAAEFSAVQLREIDIYDDPKLVMRYGEDIPVVIIDDRVHATWRVDEARLRARLAVATSEADTTTDAASAAMTTNKEQA